MKSLASVPIRQKLLLIIMGISLVGLLCFSLAVTIYEAKVFKREMVRTLSTLAQVIGSNSTAAITFRDKEAARESVSALKGEPHVVLACIYLNDRTLFASYRRTDASVSCADRPDSDGWQFNDGTLTLSTGIFLERERIGDLLIQSDLQELHRRVMAFAIALLILASTTGFISYLLSLKMQQLISIPIIELAGIAQRLAKDENYMVRAQRRSRDEVGFLVDSFNKMLDKIQERDRSIHQSNEELIIAKEKAESASRIKSEFLDIAAHELRTPLTALTLMIGTMQQFQRRGIPIDPATLDKSAQQVDRLARLVGDLLNVSVLERGALVLHREKINLIEIISESLDNYRRLAPGRLFVFEKPEKPIMLDADPVRLIQVLGNFLDNALKYTPESSPIVIAATTTPDDKVRVAVTDKGKGIAKESLPQLFTRFYRTGSDETLKQPGLGLGLYICRRIIERHGGNIGVNSEVGHGSTFYFEIPTRGA